MKATLAAYKLGRPSLAQPEIMAPLSEFLIEILFEKGRDGRFYVHSPNLAGLHLAGRDLSAIRADLEPIVKELLFHNLDFVADQIRWVPSLDEVVSHLTKPSSPPEPRSEGSNYLVITGRAA